MHASKDHAKIMNLVEADPRAAYEVLNPAEGWKMKESKNSYMSSSMVSGCVRFV